MPFLAFSLSKTLILLHLLFLPLLRYLLLAVLACKKNSCYFCDVCGLFEVLLGHFFISKSGIWLKLLFLLFLRYLSLGILSRQEKSLLFLRFLRYLSSVFLASKKNPCYFCDFCDICGLFGALLGLFSF